MKNRRLTHIYYPGSIFRRRTLCFCDRVYVYGSHDYFNGYVFSGMGRLLCVLVSPPMTWATGDMRVIYPKTADPLNPRQNVCVCPDVTVGPDGRYYLYYVLDKVSVVSVAVCDSGESKNEFYGYVHYEDGTRLGERKVMNPSLTPGF